MIIQATRYGTAEQEEPFAFTYSGDFTDERVDGIGDVTLNTSGTLTVTKGTVVVSVQVVGAGGGAARWSNWNKASAGGGGGIQTVEVELAPGTYDIVIGTGGNAINKTEGGTGTFSASQGGTTTAFGRTSTGGKGGTISNLIANCSGGSGGSPNGNAGNYNEYSPSAADGGAPNGGSVINSVANNGGDGLVRITFS